MNVALDTNILAYAEGVNGASLRKMVLGLLRQIPPQSVIVPTQALGELFNVLVRKAGWKPRDARTALLAWSDAFATVATTTPIMHAAADLAASLSRSFRERMADDLDTPGALAALFDFVRAANSMLDGGAGAGDASLLCGVIEDLCGGVLGIVRRQGRDALETGREKLVEALSLARSALRSNRLFRETDEMRRILAEAGYSVRDLPDGTSLIEKN